MLKQRTFTVDDLKVMDEAGLFADQRVQLLDGVIYDMSSISPDHVNTVDLLAENFMQTFARHARVRVQNPIDIGEQTWLPVPDLALVHPGDYSERHPSPNDIPLLVEVSSSTLRGDLGRKLEKYAQAGVPDYWLADLSTREWVIHRDPAPGRYRSMVRIGIATGVAPLAFPDETRIWLER